MDAEAFAGTAWYSAAALDERVALRRTGALSPTIDEARAGRRDRRWRADRAFAGPAQFAERLRAADLTDDEFIAALGATPRPDRSPPPPRWLQTFDAAFATRATGSHRELDGLAIVEPLIAAALERATRLASRLVGIADGPLVDPDGLRTLLDDALPRRRLRSMLARTVVLELNVARLRGELTGATPQDRHADFLRRLADPAYAAHILRGYPVLARQLVETLDAWVTCQTELLERLCGDWSALCAAFFPDGAPGALVTITPPQGDLHRGGRAVLVVHFAGGQRLVYKPRSLAVEVHFGALVSWLNARLGGLTLAAPAVLDRGAYGWTAFAEHVPCTTEADVREFYTRLGGLTALMTVLDATDIHSENLIASGAHPLLVDLECLFHPRAYVHLGADGKPLAEDDEFYTVLRTGILPARSWSGGDHAGIDTSALGGEQGQELPDPALILEQAGTDESRFVAGRATLTDHGRHRPTLAGAPIAAEAHDDAMVAGFAAVYRCVLAHRDELCAAGGPLAAFGGDEIRVLVRDTRTYGLLLDDALHPDHLRDALDRDQLFDRLWADVARRPYYASLVQSEQADLRATDVPMFTTRTNARDLWDSRGQRIPEMFDRSSLEMVHRQVARLSEADLIRQTWAIRAAFDAVRMNRHEATRPPPHAAAAAPDEVAPRTLIALAREVGDHLDLLAMRGEAMACWAGVLVRKGTWSADIVDHSLHSGTGGIALFLGQLGAVTGERRYTDLARMAVETVCFVSAKRLREGSGPGNLGLYFGWGGVFHVLASASALWSEPRYLDLVRQLTPVVLADVERHGVADVAGGVAGFLLGLLTTYRVSPDPRVRDAAIVCGERLLQLAQATPTGLSWRDDGDAGGFARGGVGIAHVLSLLADTVAEPRFRTAAERALAHERHRREPWRADGATPTGWAAGAAGVGLVSLAELTALPAGTEDPALTRDVADALEQVALRTFGADHSLGSGDLGCLELLLQSRDHASFRPAGAALDRRLADLVAGLKASGWQSGLPGGRETPGLVDGLAGIGYQLLRLAAPDRVPPMALSPAPP